MGEPMVGTSETVGVAENPVPARVSTTESTAPAEMGVTEVRVGGAL